VVGLAIAGATVRQIATFTGHSLNDVEAILDAHYLGSRPKLFAGVESLSAPVFDQGRLAGTITARNRCTF
jgi:hypothetical protein